MDFVMSSTSFPGYSSLSRGPWERGYITLCWPLPLDHLIPLAPFPRAHIFPELLLILASGTRLALFQAIVCYSVPIYVWIYENGTEDLKSHNPYFASIFLNSSAASKPCKRAKHRISMAIKGRETGKRKENRLTFLFIFMLLFFIFTGFTS